MKPPPPRTLLKLGVFLLLLSGGAIVNVGVVWTLAVTHDITTASTEPIISSGYMHNGSYWYGNSWNSAAGYSFYISKQPIADFSPRFPPEGGPALDVVIPAWAAHKRPAASKQMLTTLQREAFWGEARGWPARSLCFLMEQSSAANSGAPTAVHGIEIKNRPWQSGSVMNQNKVLPLLPLWPGFAINTIFYAALLWVLWITPGKIRRLMRTRGHRCPTCGFIIAAGTCANGLCSECGAVLPLSLSVEGEGSGVRVRNVE